MRTWIRAIQTVLIITLCFAVAGPALAHDDSFEKMGVVQPKRVKSAPDFVLRDIHGKSVSLKDYRGKSVLLNFWATWCEACKQEMPSMERLYQKLRHKGVEVVAVAIDRRNEDRVREFVQKHNLTFPVLIDQKQNTRRSYYILGIPTSYLIDPQGKLRGFASGARVWDRAYAEEIMESLESMAQPHLASRPSNTENE